MSKHLGFKRISLLLPILIVAFATAREKRENWIEVRSPRFAIVTDSSEKQARRIAAQFERMRAFFHQAYPQLDDDPEAPVFVLAVKNKSQFRTLEPKAYLSKRSLPLHGFFVRAAEKNYILMRLDEEAGNPYPVVYHEYTHLFLHPADERMPLWLNEGLAEFYENTEIYGQEVLLGEPNQQRLMLLRQEKLLPLATLFMVDEKSPYYLEEKKGSVFYAECWALTHYLTLKDDAEKTSKVREYTTLVNENLDPVTAATRVFGDLRKLQRTLELYIEQRSFDHFEAKILTEAADSDFKVQPITPAQAEALEADFLAASGRLEESQALLHSQAPDENSAQGITAYAPPPELAQAKNKIPDAVGNDTPCPLSEILHGASERATEMVENLQRFTATERIEHTEFKRSGKPSESTNQLFSYTAEIDQSPSGLFWVDEYRTALTHSDPPPLSDSGTAAFALIFHPDKIGNFEFRCAGRTDLRGTAAWLLRFEETSDPRKSFHQIRINHSVYQLRFQGHAWIAADTCQILQLETDLVAPIPQIRLQLEHLEIAYAPVEFDKRKLTVWLPERASMQIDYRGRRYQRVHNFNNFHLFLVVTQETVKAPSPGPGGE